MGRQGLVAVLEKKTIKSRFKVYEIWLLNLATMVEKFNPNEVFITTKEEGSENAY
jgi:hypothetical protein